VRPRVAVLEASHWHVPLYLEALAAGADVVAVSDREAARAAQVAARFGAQVFTDWRQAVNTPGLDLVFAFGRHREMPSIARGLIERGVPFVIEKPGGLCADQVADVARLALERGVAASVPLVQRLGPLPDLLARIGPIEHCAFRFLAGPPSRYPRVGCGWMLEASEAGGGCFVNLGIHFVDLFRLVAGEPVSVVGRVHRDDPSLGVEDHAVALLEAAGGASAVIETGYLFPESPRKREISYYASGTAGFVSVSDDGVATLTDQHGQTTVERVEVDSDPLYALYVSRVLESYSTRFADLPTLDDLHAAMLLVDRVYASAGALA
jgi:predicted dehydrogenase